jgi:uncharacterized protein DUF929
MSTKRARPVRKPVARTPVWVGPAAIAALLALVVATFLVIRWYTTPLPPKAPAVDTTQQIVSQITNLPASEFESIGQGTANNLIKPVTGTPLTGATGKPEVFYLGGEFCPYCAAERWPLIIALSRFGTFSGLVATSSSSSIEYPNTPTFTFRSATYTSQYLDFRGVESSDRDRNPLQSPTASEQQLFQKYDTQGTIPFVDLGNRYAFVGSMYLPDVLADKTWQSIANDLQDPGSTQAKAIIGSANLLTAAICKMTSDQPTTVCSSATIQSLEKKLG